MYVFEYLSNTTKRFPDALPMVVLQKGEAEVPLCSTHRLHDRTVPIPHSILQPLIQFADLLQPHLQDTNLPIKITAIVLTAKIYQLASTFGWNYIEYLMQCW